MTTDQEKMMKGMAVVQKLFPDAEGASDLPPEFMKHTVTHLFGDIWQGPDLEIEERSLITCVILVALNREAEQKLHFVGAKNLGIKREKIEAAITHSAHYAGWPVAVSAFRILNEVWPS